MRYRIYFAIQICALAALVALVLYDAGWIWFVVVGIVLILAFGLGYRSVVKPLNAVQNGIYLLREQDFSSRLRRVGQADADKVIDMFNGMIDSLRRERLKNLEQNDFLGKLIDASPLGIAICDLDGNIRETNAAYDAMVTPEVSAAFARLSDDGSCVVRAGQSQIFRCSRRFFMDSGFRRPFFIIERMTDEIAKAETEMFNKIVRTMGHEVNNTLGSVISVLETIEDMHADDTVMADAVRSSADSCRNLGKFVKGYSDVVKLPDPQMVDVDMCQWVKEQLPTLQAIATDNIDVVTDCRSDGLVARFDPMLMQRVLINVVKNAVESIGDGKGGITICVSDNMLQVVDNGAGISAEAAEKIFTPFFSTKHQDRGLGLMLIVDILRRHKASFTLCTDPVDKLTRFTIVFDK